MNELDLLNSEGFAQLLLDAGRNFTTDAGQPITATISNVVPLTDPTDSGIARAKTPIYSHIEAAAGAVSDPNAVKTFTEEGGRLHTVIEFIPRGDAITQLWLVETQR